MIRLYAVNVSPLLDEACFENCYLHSAKERREKADALKMPVDKARCIAAGLLLEYAYKKFRIERTKELAVANSFGYVQNVMPEIVAGLHGKPEFAWPEGTTEKISFNLSHSGNYVFCVLADFEVGADIQLRTKVRESVLRRFFNAAERAQMEACGADQTLRERMFAQIWALKEAQTKLTGQGIGQLLGKVMCNDEMAEKYHIWQGILEEDYAWAVASYPESVTGEQEVLKPLIVDGGDLFYERKV